MNEISDEEVMRWYQCGRKVPHPTARGAEVAALDVHWHRPLRANPPDVYRCPYCGNWHVGRYSQSLSTVIQRNARNSYERYGPGRSADISVSEGETEQRGHNHETPGRWMGRGRCPACDDLLDAERSASVVSQGEPERTESAEELAQWWQSEAEATVFGGVEGETW